MIAVLQQSIAEVTSAMDSYDMPKAVRELKALLDETSKWYIRRSRDRFAAGEEMALAVLYYVIVEFCKLAAPITPFVTEEIYRNLVADHFPDYPYSVHLSDYPVVDVKFFEEHKQLLPEMETVRAIAELGQTARVAAELKVRQPLSHLYVQFTPEALAAGAEIAPWMADLLADELNVLEVQELPKLPESSTLNLQENTKTGVKIGLETQISPELAEAGLVREIVRQVQNFRKKQGLSIGEEMALAYSANDATLVAVMQKYADKIAAGVSAKTMVEDASATEEVKVNDMVIKLSITQ
jgi:isoleucyl-tRNA synthetase